jgi:hypothetical protein
MDIILKVKINIINAHSISPNFIDDKLVSIDTNEPFKFDVFQDKEENQKRYESVGRLIDQAIFDLLESKCQLQRVAVPVWLFYFNFFFYRLFFLKDQSEKG